MLPLECLKSSKITEWAFFSETRAHFGSFHHRRKTAEIDTQPRRMLILMVLQPSLFSQV